MIEVYTLASYRLSLIDVSILTPMTKTILDVVGF